ncbi:MAG: hypothetical protein ABR920_17975, partial [Terriglobales bacterium]
MRSAPGQALPVERLDDFGREDRRVPLDKSEGSVKDKLILCSAEAPFFSPERLRTKALEISRG